MADFTLSATVPAPYDAAVERVRAALGDAGFGVLTEIDIAATLQAKLGVSVPPKIILGACRPQLAHAALDADSRVAALLPCNVVISAVDDNSALVEIMDPGLMENFTGTQALGPIAAEARTRLVGALAAVAA